MRDRSVSPDDPARVTGVGKVRPARHGCGIRECSARANEPVQFHKHALIRPQGKDVIPSEAMHLMAARNVLNPKELKFFVSNAPSKTPVSRL